MLKKLLSYLVIIILIFTKQSNASTPNILFLFSDDQCWDTIGIIGNEVETPNLDKMVKNGVFFENAYNSGAWQGAVCMASRTMLMLGKQLWDAHKYYDDQVRNPADFWSTYLKRRGYKTYFTGKWHISNISPKNIYDVTGTIRPGMPNYSDPKLGGNYRWDQRGAGYFRPSSKNDNSWCPSNPIYGGFWEGGIHWSEVIRKEAIDFIYQAANSKEPFFMQIAFNAPHDPRQSPDEYIKKYPIEEIGIPVNFLPENPHVYAMELAKGMARDEDLAPFPRTIYSVKKNRQEYFALISYMDMQIGKIIDALRDTKQIDNTVIIFTSDHGLSCGQHGLMGKQNMFEHSMKPPLIISGPGFPKGKTIKTPVYLQDIMPTTLELAQVPIPDNIAFKSLLPVIKGKQSYSSIYGAYKDKQRMIRKNDFKLVWYPESETYLLFDLLKDPYETNDLIYEKDKQKIVNELKKELYDQQLKLNDPMLTGNYGNLKE